MKNRILPALLLPLLAMLPAGVALAQDELPGEGATVRPAVANWQSAQPVSAIVGNLLEELGYEIEPPRTLANAIFYQALVRGDVDFWPNSWMPQQSSLIPDDFDENAAFVGTIVEAGAIQGYLASKDAVEEYGITSLADFERPEVREAFDPDGDGLIDLLGCEAGWACADIVQHHLEAYGLQDVFRVITSSYTAGFADVLARARSGEPVVYYTWTPNFTLFELAPGEDVMWINVPEIAPTESQEELVESMTASGIEGAVTDPLKLGFSANDIRVAANAEFLDANPAARALFERIEIPLADISAMTQRIREGEDGEEEIDAMAEGWIEENRTAVETWLDAARDASAR